MKTRIAVLALIAVTAGAYVWTRPHSYIPSDLRDAVADNGAMGQLQGGVPAKEYGASVPTPEAPVVDKRQAAAEKQARWREMYLAGQLTPEEYSWLVEGVKDTENLAALKEKRPVPYPESMPAQERKLGAVERLHAMYKGGRITLDEYNWLIKGTDVKAQPPVFYGHVYSKRLDESPQEKAQKELDACSALLKNNGIEVIKAGVIEKVKGYLQAMISYKGKEVLFRAEGTAVSFMAAQRKKGEELADLEGRGALIITERAWRIKDVEGGGGGAYEIVYFLK